MSYIHKETFRIRPSEINHLKNIHPYHLVQLMQEASMQHTIGLKVSVWDLEEKNISWVLIKMDVHFYRYPALGENVEVQTYPSGLDGFFTYRDYFVYDESGFLCATASSTWTLLDTINRKMVRIPESFSSLVYKSEHLLPIPIQKLFTPTNTSADYMVTVNYLHLDWNGHVNNVQLIKMIFESLGTEFHIDRFLKRLIIQFKSEATIGQGLMVRNEVITNNKVIHAIKNEATGKDIVIASTIWS
ncbi:MAG: hypothetical protein IPO92_21670 [Saprospiraceae bacterium]|nr:hypothetical protein [Saprospiraceae bacterium]